VTLVSDDGLYEPVVHAAVARIAASSPASTALVGVGRKISFGMLDNAASFHASELAKRGVGRGDIVPVLMARSPEAVAVQLGILKTGAAYANLDRAWPVDRLTAILTRISPVVTVSGDDLWTGQFPTYRPEPADVAMAAVRSREFSPCEVAASSPATVFFTSGTTGGPKGVICSHQAVTRIFRPGGLPGFGPGHAMPQAAALPWDMYAYELWGQLTTGGTVVLISRDYLTPNKLREVIEAHGVDNLFLTASLFNLFVDEDPDCFDGLENVLTGGEKISPEHVRRFLVRHPAVALWSGYGPAESCMVTTTRMLTLRDCDVPGGVPVGTAVRGTRVLLLDANDRLCTPGQEGEICIAGEGLAMGYLGQPELTAAKFPTLHIDGSPMRIYRTGDVGLADGEGVLHFRGRRDRQIKISGHRIEMTEIEETAAAVPGVHQCVAVTFTGPDGQASLLALMYTATAEHVAPPEEPDPIGVHDHLLRQLPSYMVPSVIRCLPRFPLTANGKVDLAALSETARRSPLARRRHTSGRQ
jgi:D-alanine--poly(phosphoribitol) ligase subunit 1